MPLSFDYVENAPILIVSIPIPEGRGFSLSAYQT